MCSVDSRSSIFLCSSSTTVYPSYPWSRPAATYGGTAGPVVHVVPSQTRPKAALPRPVSKCRRGRASVTLRITKLAVRNELRPPHVHFGTPLSTSLVPSTAYPPKINSECAILLVNDQPEDALMRPEVANRATQNEAHCQIARARRSCERPHLSVASPRCYLRDCHSGARYGLWSHLRP